MSEVQQKQAKSNIPLFQNYARHEIGLIGESDSIIRMWCSKMSEQLYRTYKSIYVDADPGSKDMVTLVALPCDLKSDQKIILYAHESLWRQKMFLRTVDIAFVNCNHLRSNVHYLLYKPNSISWLKGRENQVKDTKGVIITEDSIRPNDPIYNYIDKNCPIFRIDDMHGVAKLIMRCFSIPDIRGLVLAGGKSTRMGKDKSQIAYHDGISQEDYALSQLGSCISKVYLSKRKTKVSSKHHVITDSFLELGPFGAVLSAFRYEPNMAWMVTACDQPLLSVQHIERLIVNRDASKVATCYFNPETNRPEPLITLWEPKAYPLLLQYLALGNISLRDVLCNSDIHILKDKQTSFMKNANTPEESSAIMKMLRS